MTLLELTEPLFQYICRINRAGRKNASMEYAQLRVEVQAIFDDMRGRSASDFKLGAQFKAVELALIFFVDSMIVESKLPCAREWDKKRIAYEQKELAGDEKFYDLLEEALKDPSPEASERLAVYYTCLGLGFTGWYYSQPEFLRKKMIEISQRIRSLLEPDPTARICPEDYQNVDTRDLREPPAGRIWLMVVIFIVFGITALACNIYLFYDASSVLQQSLQFILQQEPHLHS